MRLSTDSMLNYLGMGRGLLQNIIWRVAQQLDSDNMLNSWTRPISSQIVLQERKIVQTYKGFINSLISESVRFSTHNIMTLIPY